MKKRVSVLLTPLLTLVLLVSSHSFAGPRITWNYENVRNNECKNVCVRKILGNCIEWRQECNYRTKFAWSDQHKEIVKQAMNMISDRIGLNRVEKCVEKYVQKFGGDIAPSGQKQAQAWEDWHSLERASEWPKFDLVANREAGTVTAHAYVERNAWGTPSGLKWNRNIKMYINFNAIEAMLRDSGTVYTAESYAGTILHEALHQMGHTHPGTGNYNKDYEQGHFVVVAGDCVASDGDSARNAAGMSLHGRQWYVPR